MGEVVKGGGGGAEGGFIEVIDEICIRNVQIMGSFFSDWCMVYSVQISRIWT